MFNTSFKTDDAKQPFHLKVVENLNHKDEKLLYAIAKLSTMRDKFKQHAATYFECWKILSKIFPEM